MSKKTILVIMLTVMIISTLSLAFEIQPVKASGTIYIRADGSIDPPTAPISTVDNVTYFLTDNITSDIDGIIVERNDIVVDGAGKTVQGMNELDTRGMDLSNRVNVTVTNTRITAFSYGVYLNYSSNNSISGNNIADNWDGIYLYYSSSNNSIIGNNITANGEFGIQLDGSSNNNIIGNNVTNNGGDGIYLYSSSENTINGNTLMSNRWFGFSVQGAMIIQQASNNTFVNNNVTGSACGFQFSGNGQYYNKVENNMIYSDLAGIELDGNARYNTFCGNTISNNQYGLIIMNDSEGGNNYGNDIFHNNFIDNEHQAVDNATGNVWDNGYPSGGNYWSHYNGTDLYSGVYQNETGSDGIGDTPYVMDAINIDSYPLMHPYVSILGDINNDRTVDISDAILVAAAFGSYPGHSRWNSLADLNHDNMVDIFDVISLASNFGRH